MPLTTEIILHFYFPFKVFPENFTERERERARARACTVRRSPANSKLQSVPIAISSANIPIAVDRNLAVTRSHRIEIAISRSVDREIAYVGERGRSEIAIDASRDHAVDRDLGS